MKVHKITDTSDPIVMNLLRTGLVESDHENWNPSHYELPQNIFHMLDNGRFRSGCYYVVENADGEYVGSSGWYGYKTEDGEHIALAMVRTYVMKKYRLHNYLSTYMLPCIIEDSQAYDKLWITINEYNKSLYRGFNLLNKSKRAGLFYTWPEVFKKFVPIGKRTVNYTEQYVAEYIRNNDDARRKD